MYFYSGSMTLFGVLSETFIKGMTSMTSMAFPEEID